MRCPQPLHAAWQGDTAYGEVTSVSRTFGNVFTNIPISDLEAHGYELNQKYHLNISDGEETVYDGEIDYVRSFGFLSEGAPLIFNGSTLYLCIACNQASFLKRYHMDPSKHWKVTLSK